MTTEKKLKKKGKQSNAQSILTDNTLDLGEAFDPANAKESDFDLDLDCAKFQGRKGQCGSRTKSGGGGDFDFMTGTSSGASAESTPIV